MKTMVGVMGGGQASDSITTLAFELGQALAHQGWVVLCGGRNAGVMAAVAQGAKTAGGLTVGILPDAHLQHMAAHIDIPIVTGMGDARNVINVLSSQVVLALPGGAGTFSEIALALKVGRPVVLVCFAAAHHFTSVAQPNQLHSVDSITAAITLVAQLLETRPPSNDVATPDP